MSSIPTPAEATSTCFRMPVHPGENYKLFASSATAANETYFAVSVLSFAEIGAMIPVSSRIEQVGMKSSPGSTRTDELKVEDLTAEERADLFMSTFGAWADIENFEDPTKEAWGWIDWGDLEDGSELPS